ncbi:hypothetical protein GCM10029992_07690 [Glycomyces albus]
MADLLVLAAVSAAIALGSATQRITGIGIALISAPALSLAFGPVTAVPLVNIAALLLNITILVSAPRLVDWRRATTIAAASAVVIVPIAHQIRLLPQAVVQAAIGLIVLGAIALTIWLRRSRRPTRDTLLVRVTAGAAAGAFGVAAGLSGPPLAVYAAGTAWRGPTFVPTVQGASAVINTIAIAAAPRVDVPLLVWPCVVAAIAAGTIAGKFLAPRVRPEHVENAALGLAATGAATTVATAIY